MEKYAIIITFNKEITNADARKYVKRIVKDAGGIVRTIIEKGIVKPPYPIKGEGLVNGIEATAMLQEGAAAKMHKALKENQNALAHLIYKDKELRERSKYYEKYF